MSVGIDLRNRLPAAAEDGDVAEVLRAAILNGTIPPGTRLHQPQIADLFGISRTPVREALHKLSAWGLVDLVVNHPATVRHLRPDHYADVSVVWAELAALAVELSVLRDADVADALRQGIRDEWTIVEALTRDLRMPSGAGETWIGAQELFHTTIIEASNSPRLREMIESTTGIVPWQTIWKAVEGRPYPLGSTVLRHEEVMVLMRRGAAREAADAMRAHILELGTAVVGFVRHARDEAATDPSLDDALTHDVQH